MKTSSPLLELTKENVKRLVTPDAIYRYYLGKKLVYNRVFSSPFRRDKNPSFLVSNRNYYYRDFGTGETGDCFMFVKKLYNVDFNGALKQIVFDLGVSSKFFIPDIDFKSTRKVAIIESLNESSSISSCIIQVKIREFNEDDLSFWNCHGVSLKYLRIGRVYALDYFFVNGTYFKAEKYAYVYVERKDNRTTYKIYQPYSRKVKWLSNNDFSVWELWNLLPKTYDKLIITSSRKDALSIIENVKIPSTAFQSETLFPKEKVVKEILSRFNKVYLLLDNDYTKTTNIGQQHALKLVKKYNFINLVIPEKYKSKDFSDLVCNYDRTTASNLIKSML